MYTPNVVLTTCICYLCVVLHTINVESVQQIYFKTFNKLETSTELTDITYNPEQNIYPVVNLPDQCPFIPIAYCRIDDFYWEHIERNCKVSAYCPNGTHVQCVENKEYPWKLVLLVCAPVGDCYTDARNIVYFDRNTPNRYRLGKEKCEDGHYHSNSNICFGECIVDKRIRIFKKSSLTTPAIAYCNYQMNYCNAEKPELFELTDDQDVCYVAFDKGYNNCPPGEERLSDCSCDARCSDGYIRKPANDFKCEKADYPVPMDKELFRSSIDIEQHAKRLRIVWRFSFENRILVSYLKIRYWERGTNEEYALDNIVPTNPNHTDIDVLHAGQTYTLAFEIGYEYDGNPKNVSFQRTATMRPNPIENLSSNFSEGNIGLHWYAPENSRQDKYRVEYRAVRRHPKRSWKRRTTLQCEYTIKSVFPGEEYELRVYSVSSGTTSVSTATSRFIPPLAPALLWQHFPSQFTTTVIVFWYKNDTRSHVESWKLKYNSSDGEEKERHIPLPDNGNRVEAKFSDFRQGQTYSLFVYSLVGNVSSDVPASIVINLNDREQETQNDVGLQIIIIGILIFIVILIGVISLAALCIYKRERIIRYIRNNFHIDRLEANVNNDIGDLNIPLGDPVLHALNDAHFWDDSSESEDS